MKKYLLTALVVVLALNQLNAQTKSPKLGFGAELDATFGSINGRKGPGFGLSLLYLHPLTENFSLTGSAGYSSVKVERLSSKVDAGYVPLKVGARYYFTKKFFGSAEVGASLATNDYGKTGFAYAPGIGFEFPVSPKNAVELGLRYEAWSYSKNSNGFLGFRAAFNLGL